MNWLPDRPWLRTLALAGTVVAAVFLLWQSDEPPVIDDEAAALRAMPNRTALWSMAITRHSTSQAS